MSSEFRKCPPKEVYVEMTTEEKDKIVNALVLKIGNGFSFGRKDVPGILINSAQFEMVIDQMERMGFLTTAGYKDGGKKFVRAELFEFHKTGGFTFREKLLKETLEKLHLELEKLKSELNPSQIDSISKISQISASIATAIGFLA